MWENNETSTVPDSTTDPGVHLQVTGCFFLKLQAEFLRQFQTETLIGCRIVAPGTSTNQKLLVKAERDYPTTDLLHRYFHALNSPQDWTTQLKI